MIAWIATFFSRYGAALLCGLLLTLSFPNVFHPDFFLPGVFIAWFCLVPLFVTMEAENAKAAFKKGYAAGLLFFLLSTVWINNIQPMGPGALPAWICLSLYLALYPGFFCFAVIKARQRRWPFEALWIPALWTLLELLRERLLSGYPWVSLGSSQVLSQVWLPLASVTGVYGLHFVVVLSNLLVYWIYRRRREALGAAALLAIFSLLRMAAPSAQATGPTLKVAVLQGNINQDQAWTADYRNGLMGTYMGMMHEAVDHGAKLLIWPESAFPGFFNDGDPLAETLRGFAKTNKVDLIIGSTLEFERGEVFYNASVFVDAQGNSMDYRKRHLVPFGEYIPLRRIIPILDRVMRQLGMIDFHSGDEEQAGFHSQGLGVEPVICYESIYGEMIRRSSGNANLVALITLDTWFGNSAAPRYHFEHSILRAVENGVWVARAAATGISGFVGPDGRILATVPLNEKGWVMQEIPLQGQSTPYRRFGPWFLWICALILVGFAAFSGFRRESGESVQ